MYIVVSKFLCSFFIKNTKYKGGTVECLKKIDYVLSAALVKDLTGPAFDAGYNKLESARVENTRTLALWCWLFNAVWPLPLRLCAGEGGGGL